MRAFGVILVSLAAALAIMSVIAAFSGFLNLRGVVFDLPLLGRVIRIPLAAVLAAIVGTAVVGTLLLVAGKKADFKPPHSRVERSSPR